MLRTKLFNTLLTGHELTPSQVPLTMEVFETVFSPNISWIKCFYQKKHVLLSYIWHILLD